MTCQSKSGKRCKADADDKMAVDLAAARVLVGVVGIEAQRRTGDDLYTEPYSVVSEHRPQTISAWECETEH